MSAGRVFCFTKSEVVRGLTGSHRKHYQLATIGEKLREILES